MANQPIGELMETAMGKIREMVDSNTVVGKPITTPDGVTVIPVSRVSFGFGSGGSDKSSGAKPGVWGGAGAAVRVEPIGFLVAREGGVRMLSIAPPAGSTVDRVLDMVPELMDKVEGYVDKYGKKKEEAPKDGDPA